MEKSNKKTYRIVDTKKDPSQKKKMFDALKEVSNFEVPNDKKETKSPKPPAKE